ncbi:MAG: M56 family metallopeptidase, partial [Gemmatimonadales bacterium]|nr:M56 family metallopeptidase [Gemmatimonadales bacterium]
MGTSLLAGSTLLGMTGLLGLFSDWAIRATLVLLIVFGVAALMRRAAAASRHVVWAVGLVSVLVVPIIAVALPWRLNVLPSLGRGEAPAAAITTPATPQVLDRKTVSGPEQATPTLTSVTSSETRAVVTTRLPAELQAQAAASSRVIPQFKPTLLQVVIALWAAVAVVVSLRLLLGLLLAWRLTHRARPLNDPSWSEPLRWAADCLGVRTPVRLLATRDLLIPVTSGLTRPVVMVPEAARSWSDERRRAVLLHELAHVRRWDWTTQLMAHIVCALHWFNPLCWIAAKRLRAECERACDDLVLDAGTQASRYADHLLQIVRTAGRVRAPAGAIPLAQRSEFEGRLLAILEPRMEQRRMKPLAAPLIAVIVLGLSLPLAAMAPRADT